MVRLLSRVALLHCHKRLFAVVFETKNLAVLGIAPHHTFTFHHLSWTLYMCNMWFAGGLFNTWLINYTDWMLLSTFCFKASVFIRMDVCWTSIGYKICYNSICLMLCNCATETWNLDNCENAVCTTDCMWQKSIHACMVVLNFSVYEKFEANCL